MATLAAFKQLWLTPILEKDFRITARSLRFFLFITFALIIGSIAMLIGVTEIRYTSRQSGLDLFWVIYLVQSICVALAIPAYAAGTIAAERQQGTFDLLRITALQPWEVVWGKFIAIMSYVIVWIVGFLPMVAICFLYGGTDPQWVLLAYLHLLLGSACAVAFCLMLSAATTHPIKATIVGYIFMWLFGFPWGGMGVAFLEVWTRQRVSFPGTFWFNYFTISTFLGQIAFWSFCYIAATCLLKPPAWNRSTPLRIWYLAASLLSVGMMITIAILEKATRDDDVLSGFIIGLFIPAICAAVGFCGEPASPHQRLVRKTLQLPVVFRLFMPGRNTALIFVPLVLLLSILLSWIPFRDDTGDACFMVALEAFVFVAFCCVLSGAMRSFIDSAKSRVVTIATLVGLCLLPLLAYVFEDGDEAGIRWLNPFLAMVESVDSYYRSRSEAAYGAFLGFYIIASIVLMVLMVSRTRRTLPASAPS